MASPVQETPVGLIKMKFEGKYEPLLLQAAKVAYEIACIEDGDAYINSALGESFRSLLTCVDRGEIASCKTYEDMCRAFHVIPLMPNSPLDAAINEVARGQLERCHVAIRTGTDIVVSMFGYIAFFADAFPHTSKRVVYLNDCVQKTAEVARI